VPVQDGALSKDATPFASLSLVEEGALANIQWKQGSASLVAIIREERADGFGDMIQSKPIISM
jgi:hypothetical protein